MEEDVSSSGFPQHKRFDAHIQRATSLPTKAPAADATPLPLIDWQSPGSALHDHAEQQKLITVSMPSSPMPRRTVAVPGQSKAGPQQRRNISDIRQADRGAKLVFGGKLPASRIPTTPPSECKTSQAGRKSKSRPKGSSSADPWLASWQPKAKPTGEDKNQSSETKSKPSISAWRTPSLEWAVTKPETLPAAPPIEAKEEKPSRKPQKLKARLKPPPSTESNSMSDVSRQKAPETPTLNNRAALQHLAQLRNLRRLPLPGPAASLSAPVTPSAATTSDLPDSEVPVHKLRGSATSQPISPVLASPACTAPESEPSFANLDDRSGHDEGRDSSLPLDGIKQGSCSPVKPGKQKLLKRRLPKLLPSGASPLSNSTVLGDTSQQTASGTSVVHRQMAQLAAESSLAMPDMEGLSQETDSPQRVMCEGCGRGFNPKAYAVHSKICAKVFKKERKVHAAEKDGDLETDVLLKATPESLASITSIAMASSALQKGKSPNKGLANKKGQAPQPGKLPKWKQQSAQLRAAMLAAKPDKLGQAAAAFPGAVVPTDDLVPCPHCKRRFAEATAERHIPKCKETVHKASRLKVGGGKAAHMRNPAAPK